MKKLIYLFFCFPLFLWAQVPNAGFEDWSIQNNMESPNGWNSYGLVEKSEAAFSGNYAASVSSTSLLDHSLLFTNFIAVDPIHKLTGVIKVDSISYAGLVLIQANAWTSSGYYTLGYFTHEEVTTSYIPFEILFELPPDPIDSLRIAFRSGPQPIPDGIALGFSSFRIDHLQIVDSTFTAIQDVDVSKDIKVYPNPASDQLQIDAFDNQVTELSLFDLSGKLILTNGSASNLQQISVGHLDIGVYMLILRTADGFVFRKKLVVSR